VPNEELDFEFPFDISRVIGGAEHDSSAPWERGVPFNPADPFIEGAMPRRPGRKRPSAPPRLAILHQGMRERPRTVIFK